VKSRLEIKRVGIIGTGVMGRGIAQITAESGYETLIYDAKPEAVIDALNTIKKMLERAVEKGAKTSGEAEATLKRIKPCRSIEEVARGEVDLVIEAVYEDVETKRQVFQELDRHCKKECILASNTSSISITLIASYTKRPENVIGLHFFNPAPVMKLVEVVLGEWTSRETLETALKFVESLGKVPVQVKDTPGFIVNRLIIPLINEAAQMVMEGVAKPEDIDTACKLGLNHPIGPLALADLIGLDVIQAIMETLYRETGDPKYRVSPLIRRMVRAGLLGRKTGRGFYTYAK
jgi:3-hydroxybutyryl-CoA dehydrogenase